MREIEIRPTTSDDAQEMWGHAPRVGIKAWSVFWRGKLACIAGYTIEDQGHVCFADMTEEAEAAPKMTIFKTAKALMKNIAKNEIVLIASPDVCKKNAERFLMAMGFSDTGRKMDGKKVFVGRGLQ